MLPTAQNNSGQTMVTRREFHKGLLAVALSSLAFGKALASTKGEAGARFYLNRLTFGATSGAQNTFHQMGLEAWLDAELSKPASNPDLEKRLAAAVLEIEYDEGKTDDGETWPAVKEMRPYQYLDASPETLVKLLDYEAPLAFAERERPAEEVIAASFIRAAHADAQLRELMTQFWHDHFNVDAMKDDTSAAFFPLYDKVMRKNAFGNFRTFLAEVASAPSMLFYLNNDDSRASPANENYARELLELHTLGAVHYYNDKYDNWHDVPGAEDGLAEGYIDQDVYEVARAFTGWTIGDGRYIDDNTDAPVTGEMYYAQLWHDPYQKRILGVEFDSNTAPMADGNKVLDILAAHPGTARYVTGKMIRRLGVETPTAEYQSRIDKVFLQNIEAPDQLARVIRAIVLDDEFARTPPMKLRRPFEFVIAILRTSGSQVTSPLGDLYWLLARTGWTQHRVAPPTGHSDHSGDWANTRALNGLIDFALYAHDGMFDGVEFDFSVSQAKTWGEMATYWSNRFFADGDAVDAFLEAMELDHNEPLTDDLEYHRWGVSNMIALAVLTPEFMFR